MTYDSEPMAKLQLTMTDTNNSKLIETPFYIKANIMQEGAFEPNNKIINDRINVAVNQMNSLSTNTLVEAKLIYEVSIVD